MNRIDVRSTRNDIPTISAVSAFEIGCLWSTVGDTTFKPSRITLDRASYTTDCVVENGESAGRAL
jgi:hypothetical protein